MTRLALFLIFGAQLVFAETQILIFRHGEKTNDAQDRNLSALGTLHAQALVEYLPKKILYPDNITIYAENPNWQDSAGQGSSLRPLQTVTPFANSINKTINSSYNKDAYTDLVAGIKTGINNATSANQTVLIFWEHKNMPNIAKQIISQFGGCSTCTIPKKYHGHMFDQYWEFKIKNGKIARFKKHMQKLPPLTQKEIKAASSSTWLKSTPQSTWQSLLKMAPISNFWSTVKKLEDKQKKKYLTIQDVLLELEN